MMETYEEYDRVRSAAGWMRIRTVLTIDVPIRGPVRAQVNQGLFFNLGLVNELDLRETTNVLDCFVHRAWLYR